MAKELKDAYPNKFFGEVTESAINTLTFSEIRTNVSTFSKVGWILSRLEWYLPYATIATITDNGDGLIMALTSSDQITTLALSNPSVIDSMDLSMKYTGTPASAHVVVFPIVRDFSNLPGGGLLIAPRPLFVGAKATGGAVVCNPSVRGYFRQIEMKADEYLEMIDFYRIIS